MTNFRQFLEAQIVAYHGTNNSFDEFDPAKIGSTTDSGQLGRGFYFSTDTAIARSQQWQKNVVLTINNPLLLFLTRRTSSKTALVTSALGIPATSSSEEITAAAKAQGYDAVILDYSPTKYFHKEIVVWDKSQIHVANTVAGGRGEWMKVNKNG